MTFGFKFKNSDGDIILDDSTRIISSLGSWKVSSNISPRSPRSMRINFSSVYGYSPVMYTRGCAAYIEEFHKSGSYYTGVTVRILYSNDNAYIRLYRESGYLPSTPTEYGIALYDSSGNRTFSSVNTLSPLNIGVVLTPNRTAFGRELSSESVFELSGWQEKLSEKGFRPTRWSKAHKKNLGFTLPTGGINTASRPQTAYALQLNSRDYGLSKESIGGIARYFTMSSSPVVTVALYYRTYTAGSYRYVIYHLNRLQSAAMCEYTDNGNYSLTLYPDWSKYDNSYNRSKITGGPNTKVPTGSDIVMIDTSDIDITTVGVI